MNSDEKIRAVFILEVLGRPAEHLTETLHKLIDEGIAKEKNITIIEKRVNAPAPLKEKEGFFTNFAEIELEFEDLDYLLLVMFKYMPAHIEIIEPEKMEITNAKLNEFFNDLVRRLHGFDEVARVLQNEKIILEKKLKEVLGKDKKD